MTTQVQELEEIDKFVNRSKPTGVKCQKLIEDWRNWYNTLNWWQKNMDGETLSHARAYRDELVSVMTNSSEMGAETKASGNYTKKGTPVPTPEGYRRATQSEITPQVQSFAVAALKNFGAVSKKKGEAASIGMRYAGMVNGKMYMSQCEWHFDNHPKGGGDPFWHMGSSIFVPINPVSTTSSPSFRTEDQSTAALSKSSKNNPYA